MASPSPFPSPSPRSFVVTPPSWGVLLVAGLLGLGLGLVVGLMLLVGSVGMPLLLPMALWLGVGLLGLVGWVWWGWWQEYTAVSQHIQHLHEEEEVNRQLLILAHATGNSYTIEDTLRTILDVTLELTKAEIGSLLIVDASGHITASLTSHDDKNQPEQVVQILGRVMDDGLAGWVYRHQEAVLIHDTREDARWLDLPGATYHARSALSAPIVAEGTVSGVLTLVHHATHHFTQGDMRLMRAAAEQLAQALGAAQVFEGQRRMLELHTAVSDTLQAISTHLNPREVMQIAVSTVQELTDWPLIAIYTPSNQGNTLQLKAYHQQRDLIYPPPQVIEATPHNIITEVYTKQTSEIGFKLSFEYSPYPAAIALPLSWHKESIGVFLVAHPQAHGLSPNDVPLAKALAESISLALHNAMLFRAISDERGRLQALIENTRGAVVMVGLAGQVLVINEVALHQFRLEGTPETWAGQPLTGLLTAVSTRFPTTSEALTQLTAVAMTDEQLHTAELTLPPKTIELHSLPVQVNHEIIGRLFLGRDVTEERGIAQMRDDLIHTMVHDLRNPLHMIAGGLDLLRTVLSEQNVLGDSESQMLSIARTSTERMLHLVNSILELSQLENRMLPINYEFFDLVPTIETVISLAQPTLQSQQLTLRLHNEATSTIVWADPNFIDRVLQNLIGNALKYTPNGGEIRVRLQNNPENERSVKISITDTGFGIPAEVQGRLFQKFSRGSQHNRGYGLGLTFCQMVIQAHQQKIWVEETGAGGTTMSFTLALPPTV
jgi:signal transduction histidine kinase